MIMIMIMMMCDIKAHESFDLDGEDHPSDLTHIHHDIDLSAWRRCQLLSKPAVDVSR